jgi:putative phage-type endonuclease
MKTISRAEWLAKRRELITASDVAAILGFDPRRTALDVYVSKVTGEEIEDNDAMLLGRELEDGIANVYAAKTGRYVRDTGATDITIHPSIPWLGATVDRDTWDIDEDPMLDPPSPLEIKHAGFMKRREWDGDIPIWLQIQLQTQVACKDASWGAYCGVVGGIEIHLGDMDRNDDFIESMIPRLEIFRQRIIDKDPPPVSSPKCLDAIKRLYPEDNGETVPLDSYAVELANEWEQAKENITSCKRSLDELEAKLRAMIGDATFGALPDGTILTLTTTTRKGYTCTVKPTTSRTMRRKRV